VEPTDGIDFIDAMRRRWLLLIVAAVAGAALGLGASMAMSPVYEGTASLLVGDFEDGNVSNNEILAMQSLAATYADIARREPVLSRAAKDLGPGADWHRLRASGHVRVPNESPQVIEITVGGTSRRWAARAAGAIASSLEGFVHRTSGGQDFVSPQLQRLEQAIERDQNRLDELQSQQDKAGSSAPDSLSREITRTQAQIAAWQDNYASFRELASTSSHVAIRRLGPAEATSTPVSPDIRFNTVMGGGLGLLLALAMVYLLEARRRRGSGPPRPVTVDFPTIVPPTLSHTTLPVTINGGSVARAGRAVHVPESHEGDVP
jgi:capsular polysaccharide biosynthesis protein